MAELDHFGANGALISMLGSWPSLEPLSKPLSKATMPGLALGLAWTGAGESPQDTPASLQVPLEAGARPHPAPRAAGGNPGRPPYNAALPVPEGPPSTEKAPRAQAPASPGGTWACPPAPCPAHLGPLPAGLPASTAALSSKSRNTMGAAGGLPRTPLEQRHGHSRSEMLSPETLLCTSQPPDADPSAPRPRIPPARRREMSH